jgi:hypothetical protein
MTWGDLPGYSTFGKARRKEIANRLFSLVRGKDSDQLLSLDDVREQLSLYEQWYVGIRSIPIEKITGSVDRAADFDRAFLPRRSSMEERWRRVESTFQAKAFPPIVVYKVDDAYFIEDGHHRVAIARQRGDEFIDGEVTEVKSPVPITATTDVADLVHMSLRQWFMAESQLDKVRPRAEIELSRPSNYSALLDIIHAEGFELMMHTQSVVSPAAAAAHWYDGSYLPTVDTIFAGNLPWIFPRATITDLYLRVHSQRRKLASVTAPHTIDDAVDSAESTASHGIKAKTRLAIKGAKEKLHPSPSNGGQEEDA